MSLLLDTQRFYLSDRTRTAAFEQAIAEVVRPGDTVLDLGCGTGILGFLACRAGARMVYAIDDSGLTAIARRLARDNGLAERIVFIEGLSTQLNLPEKVDVVVAEQFGRFGHEAGLLQYFADASRRLLKPGGRLIPGALHFFVAPVEVPEIDQQVDFWAHRPAGLDFSQAWPLSRNTSHPVGLRADQLLGAPVMIAALELAAEKTHLIEGRAAITIQRPGQMHGLGGWFEARLSPKVTLTNCAFAQQRMDRSNAFFPLTPALAVAPGDQLELRVHVIPGQSVTTIKAALRAGDGALKGRREFSSLHGLALCPEDLRRIDPRFVPRLDKWGQARRLVVNLFDGTNSLATVAARLFEQCPELFDSLDEAAEFAGEIAYNYSQ